MMSFNEGDLEAASREELVAHIRALQGALARKSALLNSAREAVVTVDASGNVTSWSAGAHRMLGWSEVEALGRSVSELIVPEAMRAAHQAGHARFVQTRQGKLIGQMVELQAAHKDGRLLPIELSLSVIDSGEEISIAAVIRDISKRRDALDALKLSEERNRTLLEHLGEGIAVLQDGKVAFANRRAIELMRVTEAEAIGANFLQWLHPDDRGLAATRQARRQNGENVPDEYELRVLDKDGTVRWMNVHATPVPWEGRPATMSFFSDVSARKRTEAALQVSEERYRAVVEHVGDGMVVIQNERFVFVNARAAEIARLPREQMLQSGFTSVIHPDDRALVLERQRRRLAGEDVPARYELRLRHGDGSITWIEIGVTLVPWDGHPATLTFFADVSHRKALERQLRETLDERETILENSIIGIAFLTPDGRFRWANRALGDIFGVDSQNHPFTSMQPFYLTREQYLQVGGDVARHISAGQAYQRELQMRRADGSVFWVYLSGKAVNPKDLAQGTVWAILDITRRKELEQELARTSEEREVILNSAVVGITYNVGGVIQWVNDKLLDMIGFERDELIGQSPAVFYGDPTRASADRERVRQSLLDTGAFSDELELRRKDGSTIWVRLAGRCVVARDITQPVIWTLLDITERRRAEEEIRDALRQQQELNSLRSRFVAMTSHEFRTPLATILSSAELIKFYADRMEPAERAEVIDSIETSVHRMTAMLDRILVIGKSDAQMLEFKPAPLNLRRLCEAIAQEVRSQHANSACSFELVWTAPTFEGHFDEKLVRHIVGNLLSNAFKYSPRGGHVGLRVESRDDRWALIVSDQGIGIPAAELPHLFESFHRASNVGEIQGTGLGLSIVKKSVDVHGGSITVASTPGAGTSFTVIF